MAFDPNIPQEGTDIDAAQMRRQFTGLKDLLDALAALQITAVQVDEVTTGAPEVPAGASASLAGGVLHFSFTVPRGEAGPAGQDGLPGETGPPFASAAVDGVTTLPAGENATVEVSFDGAHVHFTFGLPRGETGLQGTPGDVSTAQLDSAITSASTILLTQTSNNTNQVMTLDTPFADADMEMLRGAFNGLVMALRRT